MKKFCIFLIFGHISLSASAAKNILRNIPTTALAPLKEGASRLVSKGATKAVSRVGTVLEDTAESKAVSTVKNIAEASKFKNKVAQTIESARGVNRNLAQHVKTEITETLGLHKANSFARNYLISDNITHRRPLGVNYNTTAKSGLLTALENSFDHVVMRL